MYMQIHVVYILVLIHVRVHVHVLVCVAPPMVVGAWSIAGVLRQLFECYTNTLKTWQRNRYNLGIKGQG